MLAMGDLSISCSLHRVCGDVRFHDQRVPIDVQFPGEWDL